jgi:hypothetical protein
MFNKLTNVSHRIYRITRRLIIRYSFDPRPSSYPYITGDGFRKVADHIYDNKYQDFKSEKVCKYDIVFVGDGNIKKFLTEIHPNIKNPYILITHNGDELIDQIAASMIDDKIIKWYGANVMINHSRIIPLPLGIGNKHYYVTGLPSVFKKINKKTYTKINRIFYKFNPLTKPEARWPALTSMQNNKLADTTAQWLNFPNYMKLLTKYKFVISPEGNGPDCHRTWEALYVKTVPVVKNSNEIKVFRNLNLPIWVINEWNDLNKYTENDLSKKYEELMRNSNFEPLYMIYWVNQIKKDQEYARISNI